MMGRGTIVKAVVLAGGGGTAVCPLANYYSKLGFPLGSEPLLGHLLNYLNNNGITDVAVVSSDHRRDELESLKQKYSVSDIPIRVSWYHEEESKGTAGALRLADDFFGRDHFLVIQANLYIQDVSLSPIIEEHFKRGSGVTVVVEERRGAVAAFEQLDIDVDGRVRRFNVPHHASLGSAVAFSGIYVFDPTVLEMIDRNYTDIKEQLLPLLYEKGIPVHYCKTLGSIRKINTLNDYFHTHRAYLYNGVDSDRSFFIRKNRILDRVWVGQNVQLSRRANLMGPVMIGDNCVIEDGVQVIGPTTIGAGVRLGQDVQIRESIIWKGSRIDDRSRVEYSLLTDDCVVPAGQTLSNALVINNDIIKGGHDFFEAMSQRHLVESKGSSGRPALNWSLVRRRRWAQALKRGFDIAAALVALLVLAAPMALIGMVIFLTSGRPVFFRQTRGGKNGRPFSMCKFRTMVTNADSLQEKLRKKKDVEGPMFKMDRDPRVTAIGRWLRKTSLDELPQLFNVLKGEMSIVGPRPLAMAEMTYAPSWRDVRLSVRPGITGLWQVNGRQSRRFHDWIRWDVEYVLNQSSWLDFKILLKTAWVVVRGFGAV